MVSAINAPVALQPLRSAEIVSVSLPVMPAYRVTAFCHTVANRLRAGANVPTLVREQQALMLALTEQGFETAMAEAFTAEMKLQQPNPEYQPSLQQAQVQMHGILNNRIRDLHGFVGLLANPEFMAKAQAEAAQPAPAAKEYTLPPAKKEEVVRRLVQEADPAGAEPAVHVASSALGQRMVHMALAKIFRPLMKKEPTQPTLLEPLVHALARHWPEATSPELETLAKGWLKARHDPAHAIADSLKEGGELFTQAMQRVENQKTPMPLVSTPVLAPAKLETAPAMAMGGV